MPKLDLSDKFIATLKAKKKPVDYFDSKTTGLGLRVSPTGLKASSVMFTLPGTEKRARLSLGSYPATSLATARTKAIEARGKVEGGEDPRVAQIIDAHPVAGADGVTVAMLAENYIAKHGRKIKTGKDLARRLRVDVLPIIGTVKLAVSIGRDFTAS